MPFDISNQPDVQILKLEGAVTIGQAQELATRMAGALEHHTPVSVDTHSLEDIDTCILQLLCSLQKTALALSFDNPSEAFVKALERCGLRRQLIGARESP
jgi:anti-anti-sigma regulatory factor